MKKREKDFCRLTAVYADVLRAAREAGYKKPEQALSKLITRGDIAAEIRRMSENSRSVYRDAAAGGLYRLACGAPGDAITLALCDSVPLSRLKELELSAVQEIKRTDKGVEIKFCDRIKALDKLAELEDRGASKGAGSLIDAITRSAQALSASPVEEDAREV